MNNYIKCYLNDEITYVPIAVDTTYVKDEVLDLKEMCNGDTMKYVRRLTGKSLLCCLQRSSTGYDILKYFEIIANNVCFISKLEK